ncbi:NINE protein [Octadecabacter sp. R77987]|uniref:NINE protein n=1 Tax=Octadecabacter sp. R77987 TaxID=3093874 RepID=UPI00366AEBCE
MTDNTEKSPKSYGVAVTLCGIFGVMGIHHFYLEDYLHGIADLALFVLAIWLFTQGNDGMAVLVLLVDALHSVIIFYYLIIEKWRDGQGRPIRL